MVYAVHVLACATNHTALSVLARGGQEATDNLLMLTDAGDPYQPTLD
jgi:hypothetical protein